MAKVSICITYYNQQDFVRQSIDSVLAIDFPCSFEILCGDDGSTDGTLNIIKEYVQKYPYNIKYFVMDRNETQKSINRASQNRLNLAEHASGDFILFLDGDDYYCDKQFVKDALNILQNNEKLSACAFNFEYLKQDGTIEIFNQKMKAGIIKADKYIKKGFYTPSGAFIFKNIFSKDKIGFLSKFNNFDDNAITIYILQSGSFYYFNRPVYVYRQSGNSLWNSISKIERHLLNAFDYKLISDTAPKFADCIAKRQLLSFLYIYFYKRKLKSQLNNKYQYYLEKAEKNNDILIKGLLNWNDLTISEKINIHLKWINYAMKAINT